ncbi:MAG: M15 family metallopeptidase [Bacteroides sp.]|nr:M15 family metallopeptidase [Bacteroides sp.]MCM1550511.1 M15 family metallopeptidase [Clostridium sp.]
MNLKQTGTGILCLLCLCVVLSACGTDNGEALSVSQEPTETEQEELVTTGSEQEDEDTAEEKTEKTDGASATNENAEEGDTEAEKENVTTEANSETIANLNEAFYATTLSEEIKERITGISYPNYEPYGISYDELRYVHVLHYNLDHEVKEGELICNQLIAEDLVEIFQELFNQEYPIERICLVEEYNGDDETSMRDNNTSCFNYRVIAGSSSLSNHSFGLAIDINPLYNPYVSGGFIQPATGAAYTDRSGEFPYKIDREDLCYQLFTEHGFTWGGDWSSPKDYQHFEYVR